MIIGRSISKKMLTSAITELERGLPKLEKTSYSSIDKLMRTIMKKYDLTAKELHNGFVSKHDQTPDEWIKGKEKVKTFKEFYDYCLTIRSSNF